MRSSRAHRILNGYRIRCKLDITPNAQFLKPSVLARGQSCPATCGRGAILRPVCVPRRPTVPSHRAAAGGRRLDSELRGQPYVVEGRPTDMIYLLKVPPRRREACQIRPRSAGRFQPYSLAGNQVGLRRACFPKLVTSDITLLTYNLQYTSVHSCWASCYRILSSNHVAFSIPGITRGCGHRIDVWTPAGSTPNADSYSTFPHKS
jgi:hypothetical protein